MREYQYKTTLDVPTANILRRQAARWGLSISELIAFCVREKMQIDPFTDAEMLSPDHPINIQARKASLVASEATTVVTE